MAPPKKDPVALAVQVRRMALRGNTYEDIAYCLGLSKHTLMRRGLDAAFKLGKARRRDMLRRAQFKKAMSGDTAMLIWFGKNELGQQESPIIHEHHHEHELVASDDELRTEILRRLARIALARGEGATAGEIAQPDPPRAGDELRLLGPGDPTGTTG